MRTNTWIVIVALIVLVILLFVFLPLIFPVLPFEKHFINESNELCLFLVDFNEMNLSGNHPLPLWQGAPSIDWNISSEFLEIKASPKKVEILCKPSNKEPEKILCESYIPDGRVMGGWWGKNVFICRNEGVYFIHPYGDWGSRLIGPFNLTDNSYLGKYQNV